MHAHSAHVEHSALLFRGTGALAEKASQPYGSRTVVVCFGSVTLVICPVSIAFAGCKSRNQSVKLPGRYQFRISDKSHKSQSRWLWVLVSAMTRTIYLPWHIESAYASFHRHYVLVPLLPSGAPFSFDSVAQIQLLPC